MIGKVEWIGIRPERKAPVISKESVQVDLESGIEGDHQTAAHRQVTIISMEHLQEVKTSLNADAIDPSSARRNLMISGIDFDDLLDAQIQIGSVQLEVTGYCHPCQRMDDNFGEGGRLAMARKAGWTTRVVSSGIIKVGDKVSI